MPRWLKVARGMIGTGLTFAVAVGAVSAIAGTVATLTGALSTHDLIEVVSKTTVAPFLVGVGFSGALALVARGRSIDKLSLPFITTLGASGGLLYFLAIGVNNGFKVWSLSTAVLNLVLLLLIGSSAAAGTLVVARRAMRTLRPGNAMHSMGEGGIGEVVSQPEQEEVLS